MLAVLHDRLDAVKLLLDKGASITIPDNYGRTALHRAVIPNEQQIVIFELVKEDSHA